MLHTSNKMSLSTCFLIFLLESFRDTRRGVFPLDKTEIKNFASSGSHIRVLPICNSDQTENIKTLNFPK